MGRKVRFLDFSAQQNSTRSNCWPFIASERHPPFTLPAYTMYNAEFFNINLNIAFSWFCILYRRSHKSVTTKSIIFECLADSPIEAVISCACLIFFLEQSSAAQRWKRYLAFCLVMAWVIFIVSMARISKIISATYFVWKSLAEVQNAVSEGVVPYLDLSHLLSSLHSLNDQDIPNWILLLLLFPCFLLQIQKLPKIPILPYWVKYMQYAVS